MADKNIRDRAKSIVPDHYIYEVGELYREGDGHEQLARHIFGNMAYDMDPTRYRQVGKMLNQLFVSEEQI